MLINRIIICRLSYIAKPEVIYRRPVVMPRQKFRKENKLQMPLDPCKISWLRIKFDTNGFHGNEFNKISKKISSCYLNPREVSKSTFPDNFH